MNSKQLDSITVGIVKHMLNYQKKHNIERECIMNSLLLVAIMKELDCQLFEPEAVIVLGKKNGKPTIVSGHMAVRNKNTNKTIECSYEIFSLTDRIYFDNIKELMDVAKQQFEPSDIQEIIKSFLNFKEQANTLISNMGPERVPVPRRAYSEYIKQKTYVRSQLNNTIKQHMVKTASK